MSKRIKLRNFFVNLCLEIYQKIKDFFCLRSKRRESKRLNMLLWIVVIIISSYIVKIMFGAGWAIVAIIVILVSRIFYNMEPQGFLTICAILVAAHQLYLQNIALDTQSKALEVQLNQNQALESSLRQQVKQFILEQRPYLFMKFSRDLYLRERPSLNDVLCGVEMSFHNSGRLPATIVNTQCIVSDNTGRFEDYKEWHIGTYGGFPELQVIPPQDNNRPPKDYIPAISPDAKIVCISMVISYKGPESNAAYWNMISQFWRIDRDKNGRLKPFFLDKKDNWDECKNEPVPKILPPIDWSKYKY